jgi:hypothetical protein
MFFKALIRKPWFFLVLLALIILLIWFKEGKLFATAEEGMIFYSPSRTFNVYSQVWHRAGTGQIGSFLLPIAPMMLIVGLLESVIPNTVIQAIFFLSLFVSGLVGMYFFSLRLIKSKNIALMAALFYFFNLYVMTQIWARAIYASMLLWAYLPIYFILLSNCLHKRSKLNFIYLLGSTIVVVDIFSAPALLFTFAVCSVIFFAYEVVGDQKDRSSKIVNFSIYCLFFVLMHLWWIYPYFSLAKYFYFGAQTTDFNLTSLKSVSFYFPISQIVLLRQNFYFENGWQGWYIQKWVPLISYIIFAFVGIGIFSLKKNKSWILLIFLLLVGLFISKGTNPPLGEKFYSILFSNIKQSAILRNPYEKFGLVLLIPYSIFFAVGINKILKINRLKFNKVIFYFLLFITIGYLVWPIWTGKVFGEYVWVNTPNYYKETNDFLNKKMEDSRVLVLPLVPGHSATFKWGYRGLEPSELFFDKSSISRELSTEDTVNKYKKLWQTIESGESIEKYLKELNISYIVYRNDLEETVDGATTPDKTKEAIKKTANVLKETQIGELEIYKFNEKVSLFELEGKPGININYLRVSPRHYLVKVKNPNESFTLIFKETFHPLWQAKIGDQKLDTHFKVYDYANAWKIQKTGDYEIDLTFKVWPWE